MTCGSCGATVPEDSQFCGTCGHPLGSRGDERRVATVVFADIVGFTRLSETSDPEQVKELVDSCFEQLVRDIEAFGGKVDKIIGDAILALFGAPVAHEDDAERAVRAALRMLQTLESHGDRTGVDVQLRVGVNTGEVLVGALRAGGDYTAMGDVVNTAQRLQASAQPGTVVVGPATHAATSQVIEYEPLGHLKAKGREELIETWRAGSPLSPPGYRPRRAHTPFVGRDGELDLLGHVLDSALVRGRAHLALILGEAGVGKSRLAEELCARARQRHGASVFEGRCVPYGEANVWWPVAEALRQACGIGTADPLAQATSRATRSVVDAIAAPEESAEVGRVVNGLLYLMGYEVALREIDPQRAREEATRSVLTFVEGATRNHPVVVVLSDLHWAAPVVLEMIDVLLDRLSRNRFVLVATARQALDERWRMPWGRHNTVAINLDPLDRTATGVLLDALVDTELDPELREALLDRSGGNPFYVEELVTLVVDPERVPANLVAGVTGTVPAELPDTLRGLVAARLDTLERAERQILEDASVWGPSGPVEALERMAEQIRGITDVSTMLAVLASKDVLVVEDRRWRFRSDLVREVAYNTLTKTDRAVRHFGIASFLDRVVAQRFEANERTVDVIAFHYASAAELVVELGPVESVAPDVVDRALDWLEEAACRAQVAQVSPVAAKLFTRALDLLAPDDRARRQRFLLGRASSLVALRRLEEARLDLGEADELAELCGDRSGRAAALVVLGDLEQKAGDLGEATDVLTRAVEAYAALDDPKGLAESYRMLGMTLIFRGQHREAEASILSALELSRGLGDRRQVAWALQNLAWISFLDGDTAEAEARLSESAVMFTELGDSGGLSWAQGVLAYVWFHEGRLEEAEQLGERVLTEASERGDRWGEGMMLELSADILLWTGRTAEAVTTAERGLAAFRSINDHLGEAQAIAILGRCLVLSGRVAEGMALLQEAFDTRSRDPDAETPAAPAALGLAGSALHLGDPALAAIALSGAGADETEPDASGIGERDLVVDRGLLLLQEGRVEEAAGHLAEAAADRADGPAPFAASALALALAAQGLLDRVELLSEQVEASPRATYLDRITSRVAVGLTRAGSGEAAAAGILRDCVDRADATGDRVSQALTRLALGLGLEAMGDPGAAEAIDEAENRLQELGVHASGWRLAFGLVLARDPSAVAVPTTGSAER